MMSLLKLLFILSGAFGMHITARPPNPPRPFSEHIIPDWREKFLKSLGRPSSFVRGLFWMGELMEVAIILANQNPAGKFSVQILSVLMLYGGNHKNVIRVTPAFLLGSALMILGGAIRIVCYRTLNRHFTFELTILDNHKLITTGPYKLVRHPSYTGMVLTTMGAFFRHAAPGSWARESGVLKTPLGMALAALWVVFAGAVILSLILRVPVEDNILKKRFGEDWVSWANKVPYVFIPGVY